MILTVTLNPSVDIGYKLNGTLNLDDVNRVTEINKTAGGKGLNVSRVLKQLKNEVKATGFLGGHLGEFIAEELSVRGIKHDFVSIKKDTRNCISLLHEGMQTEILEKGPTIDSEEAVQFLNQFAIQLKEIDVVTLSGSLPAGLPDDFYNQLLTIAQNFKIPVLLDTKEDLLEKAIKHTTKPFLIKPNAKEVAGLFQKDFQYQEDLLANLQSKYFSRIPWIVVTLGADGAIIKCKEKFYKAEIPVVKAINPVGSGDAVLAGFASAFHKGMKDEEAIRYSLAMGVSNAMEEQTGCVQLSMIGELMDQICLLRVE
ncbi:hexose kinase [Virgibacillus senegalensis]|uniref:hexose kinase n=1 Tax=Virgibacillus senegalensis TaxID=1499679 RepID=UPI00069D6471|nr:hexose kinase [Virgibacillus senegalensis]